MAGRLFGGLVGVQHVAADIAGRDAEMAAGGDENMSEVLADAVAEREGLDGPGAGIGGVDLESHALAERLHEGVHQAEPVAAGLAGDLAGEIAEHRVGGGQRRVAQIEDGRKAFDLAAEHAGGIDGLDAAFGGDGQRLDRPVEGEFVQSDCRGVGRLVEAAVMVDVDAPGDDVLPVVAAWQQPQHLDGMIGRRGVAVGRLVVDVEAHGRQIRYCSVMALPRRPLSAMNALRNSCRPGRLKISPDLGVLQAGADRARGALRRPLAAIGQRQFVEVAGEVVVAAGQRARHLLVEHQQVGDEPGLEALVIDPADRR